MAYPSNITQGVPKKYQGNLTWVNDPRYAGGGYWAAYNRGQHYSYAQLERLWLDAGGTMNEAPYMAYIAEYDESGGNAGEWNSSGATGLWQIEWPSNYGSLSKPKTRGKLFEPLTNAQTAVKMYDQSGYSPWGSDPKKNLNIPPSKSVPNVKANAGGSGGSGGNPVTTSLVGNLLGIPSWVTSADIWERIGLVLLGGILIIIGLVILALPTVNEKGRELAGLARTGRSLGLGGGGGTTGPSPEVQAERQQRMAIVERNTQIGERKVAIQEAKERRLQLGGPRPKRHRSGMREPNPAPSHS